MKEYTNIKGLFNKLNSLLFDKFVGGTQTFQILINVWNSLIVVITNGVKIGIGTRERDTGIIVTPFLGIQWTHQRFGNWILPLNI